LCLAKRGILCEFCFALLEDEGVSTTPGSVFGESGEGHIRVSYATDLETLSEAVKKIKIFVDKYAHHKAS